MSELAKTIGEFHSTSTPLAVFCSKNDTGSTHCGIIFKDLTNNGITKIFDLGFHYILNLSEEMPKDPTIWVEFKLFSNPTALMQGRIDSIINFIKTVYDENKNSIPYAINYFGGKFEQSGKLLLDDKEHGLSCATFVLAFLGSVDIPLADINTWPERKDDEPRHQELVGMLKKYQSRFGISDEHIRNVQNELGCARYRPEEITAASTYMPLPAIFEYCEKVGLELCNTI